MGKGGVSQDEPNLDPDLDLYLVQDLDLYLVYAQALGFRIIIAFTQLRMKTKTHKLSGQPEGSIFNGSRPT